MKTLLWMLSHSLKRRHSFLDLTAWLGVIGMALAVACLVVTMAVVSGYISTLQHSVRNAFGDLIVMKRGMGDVTAIMNDIKPIVPNLVASTPFLMLEAVVAQKGQLSGVIFEGMDPTTLDSVLNLKNRLIAGHFDLGSGQEDVPQVLVGKGLASRFHLNVGDELKVVLPLASDFNRSAFRPKLGRFKVAGILDFGRYDFDSRYIVIHIHAAQKFAELDNRVTGVRLKLADPNLAANTAKRIADTYGMRYWTRDWFEVNRNLFEAAQLEKIVIFFVLLILVIAASFNVTSMMFVSVMRRYPEISVLRTLGGRRSLIRALFIGQGLVVGWIGAGLGVILGLILCGVFEYSETRLGLIPSQVYKLDKIVVDVRLLDLAWILLAATIICLLSTLIPAEQGSRIEPIKGLRYE